MIGPSAAENDIGQQAGLDQILIGLLEGLRAIHGALRRCPCQLSTLQGLLVSRIDEANGLLARFDPGERGGGARRD